MFEWMQDIAPYGILSTDARLILRSWNHWLETHSGIAAEDIIGRPLLEAFPELAERKLDEHFRRALQGEVSVLSTALHRYLLPLPAVGRESGRERMLQTVRIAPLPLAGGAGTITFIEDVTQRERQAALVRRQQEHDRLLSDVLALLLESDRPLETATELFPRIAAPLKLDAFFNYLCRPGDGELHLHAAGGITPEARRTMAALPIGSGLCGQVAARRSPIVEFRISESHGPAARDARRLGFRSYAGFPLVIGDRLLGTLAFASYERDELPPEAIDVLARVAQFLSIAIDRAQRESELRTAQGRLSEHAIELEARIAERTAKLHETIAQLESFSYTVAHDLRAPIRSLTGFTGILVEDYRANLPEEAQAIVERLHRASHRLDALTRDLLKFSRIVREDVRLAPVDVQELVQEIIAMTPALQADVVRCELPLGCVQAQRTLLQQCLSNLFDNALKFVAVGTRPRIVVRGELRTTAEPGSGAAGASSRALPAPAVPGRRWRIWVEDNGIGIPEGARERIFGIFERIPGPLAVEGTGIGLAIVARATEQMGGTCGVESKLGEGSRFWIELAQAALS